MINAGKFCRDYALTELSFRQLVTFFYSLILTNLYFVKLFENKSQIYKKGVNNRRNDIRFLLNLPAKLKGVSLVRNIQLASFHGV